MDTLSTPGIMTGAAARELVVKSLAQSARAIGASLGPLGRGLMYGGGSSGPRHANGGLAIARQIAQENGAWSVAPRILRDALWEAQRDLGDGTARTACIAVARSEYSSGVRFGGGGQESGSPRHLLAAARHARLFASLL